MKKYSDKQRLAFLTHLLQKDGTLTTNNEQHVMFTEEAGSIGGSSFEECIDKSMAIHEIKTGMEFGEDGKEEIPLDNEKMDDFMDTARDRAGKLVEQYAPVIDMVVDKITKNMSGKATSMVVEHLAKKMANRNK